MAPTHPIPTSLADLFRTFTLIGLQGFGGVLAIIQRELVEKKQWMTREEFLDEWAVAQILPGPNVVNVSLILGNRYFGVKGALTALAGLLLVPLIILLLLGTLYSEFSNNPHVIGATHGMAAVTAGLIIATGLKLVQFNVLGKLQFMVFAVVCFVCVGLLRWPLLGVLLVLGPIAWFAAFKAIQRCK